MEAVRDVLLIVLSVYLAGCGLTALFDFFFADRDHKPG